MTTPRYGGGLFALWPCLQNSHVCDAVQLRRLACLCLSVVPVHLAVTIARRRHARLVLVGPVLVVLVGLVPLVLALEGLVLVARDRLVQEVVDHVQVMHVQVVRVQVVVVLRGVLFEIGK